VPQPPRSSPLKWATGLTVASLAIFCLGHPRILSFGDSPSLTILL
jgi:hypothetical protein